jgi:hypothetical protein
MGRYTRASKGRCDLVQPSRKPAATEVEEWLDGVLADPDLASAVEERMVEMRAEQDRVAQGEGGLRPGRDLRRTRRGTASGRRNGIRPSACRTGKAPKKGRG